MAEGFYICGVTYEGETRLFDPPFESIRRADLFIKEMYPELKQETALFRLVDYSDGNKLIDVRIVENLKPSNKPKKASPTLWSGVPKIPEGTRFQLGDKHAAKDFYAPYVGKIGEVVHKEGGPYYEICLYGDQFNDGQNLFISAHFEDILSIDNNPLDVVNPDAPPDELDMLVQHEAINGRINLALDLMKTNPEEARKQLEELRPLIGVQKLMRGE